MCYIAGAGLLITLLVCVPPWGFLNRHPVKWQKAVNPDAKKAKARKSWINKLLF